MTAVVDQGPLRVAKNGRIGFNFGSVCQKGQRIGTGQCAVQREDGLTRVLHPTGNVVSHGAAR